MDEWFALIVHAVKQKQAHPEDRRQAVVRAGIIAQAYVAANETTLSQVFGSDNSVSFQNNNVNKNAGTSKTSAGGATK